MSSLWEWLSNHVMVLGWLGVALILGTIELTTLDFFFLMLAFGAASGSVTAAVGGEFLLQLLVAVGVSVALLGVVRPAAKRRFLAPATANFGVEALIGQSGFVVERVNPDAGLVKFSGEVWTARPYDGRSIIEPGTRVDIIEIRGATALVHPAG